MDRSAKSPQVDDPISAQRLSHLVGLIYDCAIDPARWPIAMEAIRTELDFHNATLDLILLPSGKALSNVQCNIPTRYAALMAGAGRIARRFLVLNQLRRKIARMGSGGGERPTTAKERTHAGGGVDDRMWRICYEKAAVSSTQELSINAKRNSVIWLLPQDYRKCRIKIHYIT